MNQENFFSRLKKLRERDGWSQKDIADRTGVSTNTVQSWERDVYPKGAHLIVLAEIFKCSIDWMLKGSEYPKADDHARSINDMPEHYGHCNVVDIRHSDIIKDFIDTDLAKTANMELVAIERADPAAFREVVSYIKGVANGLRISGKNRRYGDRRVSGDTSTPTDGDRRSKKDRRSSGAA